MEARNGLASFPGTSLAAAVWIVAADVVDRPRAAMSFFDVDGVRRIFDYYFSGDFGGRRAALFLIRRFIAFTDDLSLLSVGNTNCSNFECRVLLERFGFVQYLRQADRDIVYFMRAPGGSNVRQLREFRPNQHESSIPRGATAADAKSDHLCRAS